MRWGFLKQIYRFEWCKPRVFGVQKAKNRLKHWEQSEEKNRWFFTKFLLYTKDQHDYTKRTCFIYRFFLTCCRGTWGRVFLLIHKLLLITFSVKLRYYYHVLNKTCRRLKFSPKSPLTWQQFLVVIWLLIYINECTYMTPPKQFIFCQYMSTWKSVNIKCKNICLIG